MMTTNNHLANSQYVAAYQAELKADLRSVGRSDGLVRAVRDRARRGLNRLGTLIGSRNGLEADTRQIRSFDRSTATGACEVHHGLRLAT